MRYVGPDNGQGGSPNLGGADAIRSLYNPNRNAPDPRNLQDFIRPVDRNTIQDIQAAIASGLDPSQAASLLQGIGSGIDTRFGTYQQNRQDARSSAQDALMQLAQTNANPAAAQTYIDSYAQLHPNMGTNGLENLAGSLYPGGGSSPLFTGGDASGSAGPQLDQSDLDAIDAELAGGIQQGADLHNVRMSIMSKLRMLGFDQGTLGQMYDYIGRSWAGLGGANVTGAPLTTQDKIAAMAQTQAAPAAAPMGYQPPVPTQQQAPVGNPLQRSLQGALSPWR